MVSIVKELVSEESLKEEATYWAMRKTGRTEHDREGYSDEST